jgi:hypothetical protein
MMAYVIDPGGEVPRAMCSMSMFEDLPEGEARVVVRLAASSDEAALRPDQVGDTSICCHSPRGGVALQA